MRRTPVVIGATVVGLIGVLTFHTKSAPVTLGSLSERLGPSGLDGDVHGDWIVREEVARVLPPKSGSKPTATTTPPPPPTPPTNTSTTAPSTTRTATGSAVNYQYGILSVSVTASGKGSRKSSIASLDDGGSFRSQSIDQQSIPLLEQQAVQAQSANIQGVSGASYTSAGFQQSLQSALGKLGL